MDKREETLNILKKAFAPDDAYKLLEYIESRIPEDVSTQKDIYALKLDIETVRADLAKDIETVRADLAKDIETVRADLSKDIERVRADLARDIEKMRADLLKWSFTFWIAQIALLAGILFKLLT